MNSALPRPRAVPRWVAATAAAPGLLGLAGLVVTVVLGFETPNMVLFATSGALTCAALLAVLWHFAATRTLTAAERIREFTGAEAFLAIAEYMTSPDLGASARRRSENAAARRAVKNHT